jgi:uncharacterized protein YecT (DUF1311 family)
MLHKAIVAASILLLMTAAVFAQVPQPGVHLKDDKPSRTKEQKEYDKALDRAYQSAIKKIPEAEKKSDPWGNIRPTPSAAAKNKQ